jgi:hypothetical protein
MTADTDRPQDVGRSHSRKRAGGAKDRALIERYQDTLRTWLGRTLDELDGAPAPAGLLDEPNGARPRTLPDVKQATALIDLAAKIARELGAAIDPDPLTDGAPAPPRPRRTRKLDL